MEENSERGWNWIKDELDKPDRFLQHIWNKHGKKVYKFRPDEGKKDFFQDAKQILLTLADKYDQSKGVKFSTFAYSWLKGYIKGEWNDFDLKKKSLDASDKKAQEAGFSIGPLRAGLQREGSLSDKFKIMDMNEAELKNLARKLWWARLNDRERKVEGLAFVGTKQKAIADELGVSQGRVSQIRRENKEKMETVINNLKMEK